MIDPTFADGEQAQRLYKQKMETMKVLMNEIIDNPSGVKKEDMMKVLNYSDETTTDSVTDQ